MCVAWTASQQKTSGTFAQKVVAAGGSAITAPKAAPATDAQIITQQATAQAGNAQRRVDRLSAQQSLLATNGRGVTTTSPDNYDTPQAVAANSPTIQTVTPTPRPTIEAGSAPKPTVVTVPNGVSTVAPPVHASIDPIKPKPVTVSVTAPGAASAPTASAPATQTQSAPAAAPKPPQAVAPKPPVIPTASGLLSVAAPKPTAAPKPAAAPAPKPKPVVAAPKPKPKPVVAAPKPKPVIPTGSGLLSMAGRL